MSRERPPIIGITCSTYQPDKAGYPPRFGQNQAYSNAVLSAGAVPLLLPPIADPTLLRGLYDGLDALLLSGGKDVHPIHYDEPLHQKSNPAFPERDEMELTLSRWVVDDGKPLLAICRGIQVLNVALGGSLYQDIGDQVPGASRHAWHDGHPRDHLPHRVAINAGSRLASIVGATSLPVNSLHHQAIKSVASGLIVVAQAPDGIIEAAEVEGHPFALSVQWHPEELTGGDARARKLFEALVHACPP